MRIELHLMSTFDVFTHKANHENDLQVSKRGAPHEARRVFFS